MNGIEIEYGSNVISKRSILHMKMLPISERLQPFRFNYISYHAYCSTVRKIMYLADDVK